MLQCFVIIRAYFHLIRNQIYHERIKHTNIKIHFICDVIIQSDQIVEKTVGSDTTNDKSSSIYNV